MQRGGLFLFPDDGATRFPSLVTAARGAATRTDKADKGKNDTQAKDREAAAQGGG